MRAERVTDTTVIVEQFKDLGRSQSRYSGGDQSSGGNQGNTGNTGNTNNKGGNTGNNGGGGNTGNPPSSDDPPPGGGNGGNGGGNGGNGGGNGGNGGGNGGNGGGNNGDTNTPEDTNTPDTTDTPPEVETPEVPFTPGAIDTHHVHPEDTTKKRGWLVWVAYPPSITEDSPDTEKPGDTYETSQLIVKVTDGDGNTVEVSGWVLTGNWMAHTLLSFSLKRMRRR